MMACETVTRNRFLDTLITSARRLYREKKTQKFYQIFLFRVVFYTEMPPDQLDQLKCDINLPMDTFQKENVVL